MDTPASPLDVILDPVMIIAGLAVALAFKAIIHDWREAKRKRADPKMITLSGFLGTDRPNQRIAGEGKTIL